MDAEKVTRPGVLQGRALVSIAVPFAKPVCVAILDKAIHPSVTHVCDAGSVLAPSLSVMVVVIPGTDVVCAQSASLR